MFYDFNYSNWSPEKVAVQLRNYQWTGDKRNSFKSKLARDLEVARTMVGKWCDINKLPFVFGSSLPEILVRIWSGLLGALGVGLKSLR